MVSGSRPPTHEYGEAVGVLLGFPVLLATPILAWVGGRDPETMLG